ncbi:MAG TPA: hypothetical protein VGD62_03915 [Acidobacteriaceae bacterium]
MALVRKAAWVAMVAPAVLATGLLMAQYTTPVGTGAAKPKTLRATAVLEWTGSLEKPEASRLMPLAVWDGEHYQPAGLYLAQPAPLAFMTDTQYVLEQSGEEKGLFSVREAARVRGEWVGRGRFVAEAPPPPPPKLKASKTLPVLSNGKPDKPDKTDKAGTGAPPAKTGQASAGAGTAPTADDDKPTLRRRTAGDQPASDTAGDAAGKGSAAPPAAGSGGSGASSGDADEPTLRRRGGGSASTADDDDDRDRPTLHRAKDRPLPTAAGSASIDPDRPHLQYSAPAGEGDKLPPRLDGLPAGMHQLVGVSDLAPAEPQSYVYRWPSTDDPVKMRAATAALAMKAVASLPPAGGGGPRVAGKTRAGAAGAAPAVRPNHVRRVAPVAAAGPALVEEHFAAYELSFSGGATLVYSAHTDAPPAQRVYVTLIAQPDFSGQPQVLFQQVSRGDRLDEKPAMQLVDAVDTDGDQRAELIFQLLGNAPGSTAAPGSPGAFAAADPEASAASANAAAAPGQAPREFAIYRVTATGAAQVFNTGPLP